MGILYRFSTLTQPEVGKLIGGADYSAVSQARNRLLEKDGQLKARFENIITDVEKK